MGLRGPGRTPTRILKARGSPLAKARASAEPSCLPGEPKAPAGLPRAARAIWDQVLAGLSGAGLLAPVDALSLATYCRLYARWLQAERRLEREGQIIEVQTRAGPVLRRHPAVGLSLKYRDRLDSTEFVTPSRFHARWRGGIDGAALAR